MNSFISRFAERIDTAAFQHNSIAQLSLEHPFSIADAYEIQRQSIARRYQRGEQYLGVKMGFTSHAKMKQMGVHDMIWGILTDAMLVSNKGRISLDSFIHPRIEPEICFLTRKDIHGPLSFDQALDYIEAVAPALEVIDSRYENFKFSLEDVVADNCSSAALIVGDWMDKNIDISALEMKVFFDGEIVQSGSSSEILDHPLHAFVAATRLAHQYNLPLPAGSLVMAGAATPATHLAAGITVRTTVENLGEVQVSVS